MYWRVAATCRALHLAGFDARSGRWAPVTRGTLTGPDSRTGQGHGFGPHAVPRRRCPRRFTERCLRVETGGDCDAGAVYAGAGEAGVSPKECVCSVMVVARTHSHGHAKPRPSLWHGQVVPPGLRSKGAKVGNSAGKVGSKWTREWSILKMLPCRTGVLGRRTG